MANHLPHAYPRDTRSDLGYGSLKSKSYYNPRKENQSFPYADSFDEYEYSEEDDELADEIANKTVVPRNRSDMIPKHDRSAFHDVIKISETAKGMVPFPSMYKDRDGHLGSSSPTVSSIHSKGFSSKSQPSGHDFSREPLEDDEEEHIYDLEDIALAQLRECIKLMILDVQ